MTLQTIPAPMWYPRHVWDDTSAPAFTTATIDAAADRAASIFRAPRSGDIDQVAFGIGAITTIANLDLRVEGVQTTGTAAPSGTLFGTNTAATNLTPSANTVLVGTLTANATVTRGDRLALVLQENGAAAISLAVNRMDGPATGSAGGFPYGSFNSGAGYTNAGTAFCCAVHYLGVGWVWVADDMLPVQALQSSAFNTGTGATTGTRRGLYFSLAFPARLFGSWFRGSLGTTADFDIALYDSGGTLLQTLLSGFDANQQRSSAGDGLFSLVHDVDYTLAANTFYRLVVIPTTANSVTLREFVLGDAAHMGAFPGGTSMYLTKFVSSAWVEVTTERPWMGLGIDQLDDGAGGGSGPVGRSTILARGTPY